MSTTDNNKPETKVDDVETEEVVDEVEEVEETDDGVDDYVPSGGKDARYTKEDIDRAVKRRQAALEERNAARKEKAALAKELRELRKQHETDTEKAAREAEEAREAAAEAEANRYKPALIKNYIEKELVSAGVKPGRVARLVRLMEMENISLDKDFNVIGVEDEIDHLREDYPELFQKEQAADEDKDEDGKEEKPKPKRRRVPRGDGADKPAPKTELTANDRLMAQLKGRR